MNSAPISWVTAPSHVSISEAQVDVWRVAGPPDDSDLDHYRTLLDQVEHERADRYIVEHARSSFLQSRASLRTILARYIGADPTAITFRFGEHGRPSLGPEFAEHELEFNVTHSGDLFLCAVTLKREIGIDVEVIRDEIEFRSLAGRYFSDQESKKLFTVDDDQSLMHSFFRCWTRKEAYLKLKGAGLSFPLDRFQVTLLPDEAPRLLYTEIDGDEPEDFLFENVEAGQEYIATLITKQPPATRRNFDLAVGMKDRG